MGRRNGGDRGVGDKSISSQRHRHSILRMSKKSRAGNSTLGGDGNDMSQEDEEPSMIDPSRYDDDDSLLDGYFGGKTSTRNYVIKRHSNQVDDDTNSVLVKIKVGDNAEQYLSKS